MELHLYYCFFCNIFFSNLKESTTSCPLCQIETCKMVFLHEIGNSSIDDIFKQILEVISNRIISYTCDIIDNESGSCKFPHDELIKSSHFRIGRDMEIRNAF